ncbi:MAG: hypothetical protein DRR06_01520 [Gammaproteobacteria bacterium]|nr:MAG: hypothetical protein DRR06_01520 [Gammaproteobacteria bacterium]
MPRLRTIPREGWDHFFPDLSQGEGLIDTIIITQLLSVLIVIAESGLFGFNWVLWGGVSLLTMGMTLLSAVALTLCGRLLISSRPLRSAVLGCAMVMAVVALCAMLGEQAMIFVMPVRDFSWLKVFETVAIAAIPVAILLRYLFVQQKTHVQQHAAQESDVRAYQAWIRSHFLFNCMNMIASLIGSDPVKAERVVEDLSELFRHVLTGSKTLIPLREELSLCRRYLALEKMRLGDRLDIEWQIGDYGEGVQIPCLTLQPVLENAVYHGIQLIQQGGQIEIKVKREKNKIRIEVRNPRNPRLQHNKGRKTAMKNVQYRLKAHFGSAAEVLSEIMEDGYITRISYPIK